MRAARLHGPRDVRLEEVPEPTPAAGEVLVRVRAVSICASDCRLYWDGHAGGVVPDHPMIQGHEFSGDIVAWGPEAKGPPVGTRVAVEPSWHCGRCEECRRGYPNLCRNIVFPSFPQRDGALAEYIACPAHAVHALPDSVSYVEGALIEPLGVALHAVRLAQPRPDERVLILGAGAIGLGVLLCVRLRGVREIGVVEPIAGRRERARLLGAGPVAATARELIDRELEADIVFECAGEGAAVEQALHFARPAGKVMVVGIPHPERICFEANIPRRKELTVIFSRRSRETLAECVAVVVTGRANLKSFPVRLFTLEETAEAIEATAARPGDMLRAVVEPWAQGAGDSRASR